MAMLATVFCVPIVAAHSQATPGKLDDPTIVAILDAANPYDMETGSLAVSSGAPAFVAHRDRAQSLLAHHK